MPERSTRIPDELRADVQTLWDYHNLHHAPRPTDVGIGLGSHDLGVATYTAELFRQAMFPLIVFTGANAPTTVEHFPRGEAIHYREHAVELGVPDAAILVETEARNTGDNIGFTRRLLEERAIAVRSVTLISRPYQQRRAYATCRKLWPDVDVVCASRSQPLDEYVESIGDADRVITMLVGDTQRITVYAERGFAAPMELTALARRAYDNLVRAGYVNRLIGRP
ncbi:YdcF family protein [Amycolatopsis alkalitolerans]|uniref:YdcF family protein n=1 Tax=Amycolatopsis alkalitolerans TaxID=2547244 RepID=A0A5C4M3J6_9PSEU|nr:YdcF family protein [Amycolatopsis alkalitolerans]TNC26028.1 YdcF family protein [Amycolatopsis alkalitolerans]